MLRCLYQEENTVRIVLLVMQQVVVQQVVN